MEKIDSDRYISNVGKLRHNRAPLKESYDCCIDDRYPLTDLTLPQIFERGAKRNMNTGVSWWRPREFMTYTEIYEKSMKVAKGLLALGLSRGDPVMTIGVAGGDSTLLLVAAASLGLPFSAPYVSSPVRANLGKYITSVKPKLILIGNNATGADFEDPYPAVLQTLQEKLSSDPEFILPLLLRDKYSQSAPVIGVADRRFQSIRTLSTLFDLGEMISDDTLDQRKSLVSPNEPILYTFSSGSTGEPKTVLLGAAAFTNGGLRRQQRWGETPETRFACTALTEEEAGFIEQLCVGFYTGSGFLVLPDTSVTWDEELMCKEYLAALSEHKTELVYGNPCYIAYLINNPELTLDYDLSCLTGIIFASGIPVTPAFKRKTLKKYPKTVDGFGMSEFWWGLMPHLGYNNIKVATVGHACPNVEVKVVDEHMNIVPCNTAGELMFRGYATFIEYKDQPELTKSIKMENGWIKSGDCAYMDEDGDVFLKGRMSSSERFKVHDEVVYAQPIESLMTEYESINEVYVVGTMREDMGYDLTYCVVLRDEFKGQTTIEDVSNYAAANMPSETWTPVRVFFYDSFTRTGSRSKICRKSLTKDVEKKIALDKQAGLL